jgi:sec-independent protein translocase protein TatB
MFDLSIEKLLILTVVALFVLGPERLPTAATWLARTLRQIRNYANDANQKIRSEIGPEYNQIRAPLDELRDDLASLRTWRDPRTALLHHLRNDPAPPHRHPDGWKPTPNLQPTNQPATTATSHRATPTHRPRRDLTLTGARRTKSTATSRPPSTTAANNSSTRAA